MKNIETLVSDIYSLVKDRATVVPIQTEITVGDRQEPRLRISMLGDRCPRALWYAINKPEEAEMLPPWALLKYTYGHMIEAQTIALAKAAGHEVTGEQDELYVNGVKGHRDCVIDGHIVDVKSSSSMGMDKFKTGSIAQDDPFGYLDQLDGYLVGSAEDDLVRVKDTAYILAVDKTLGHMVLYRHTLRKDRILKRVEDYKGIVALSSPPPCTCKTVPHQKSGNMQLDMKASYSPQKHTCFPNLRTFLYASGPVYLTHVVKKPDVQEVDRYGKTVYH
jgi:hypothetical protein